MLSSHAVPLRPPHVVVEFGDGAHSFLLAQGATFEELADRIEELTALHTGGPVAVHVGFDISIVRSVGMTVPHKASLPH